MKIKKLQLREIKRIVSAAMSATVAVTAFSVPVTASAGVYDIVDDTDGKFYPCEAAGDVSEEWDGTIATEYAGGTGTETDPYLISNGQELAYLAQQTDDNIDLTGVYFKLTADILLNADVDDDPIAWEPIGEADPVDDVTISFNGTFDGDNHKIIGIYQNSCAQYGLFARIGENGTVKNVSVTDGRIATTAPYAGGIAAKNYGTISNCYNAVRITSSSNEDYYGGICGYNEGAIKDCTNTGELYMTGGTSSYPMQYVAGVCGYNKAGTISSCDNSARIYNTLYASYFAGICGYNNAGTISDCSNTGEVNNTNYSYDEYTGGICGYSKDGTIIDCNNSGVVKGYRFTGGVCGYKESGSIKDCYNTGDVSGRDYTGGICGYSLSKTNTDVILRCYNNGLVKGSDYRTGGICGYFKGYLIKQCYNTGTIYGYGSYTGGICGELESGEIRECYNGGVIKISGSSSRYESYYSGGIVGYIKENSILENCYNTGTISCGDYVKYIGGIWGYSSSSSTNTMKNCYNAGTFTFSDIGYTSYKYPVGDNVGQISNVYYDSNLCTFSHSTNDAWARTTEQLTAETAIADLGFDTAKWSKKPNSTAFLHYPDLTNIADDEPVYFAGAPVPTGLKAAAGYESVTLTWDAMEDAESYSVYLYANETVTELASDLTTTTYTATGLTNGVEVGFTVKSSINNTLSEECDIVYATPCIPAPTGLSAVEGDGTVTLTWIAFTGAEKYAVNMYSGEECTALTSDLTTNSYTATGLTNGVEVGFTVKLCINGEWSDECEKVYATPKEPVPVPTGLNAVAGNGTAALTWDAVSVAECYAVNMYIGDECTTLTSDLTTNSYTATGLTNGVEVGFTVKLCINGEWSDECEKVYATPTGTVSAPTNVKASAGDGKVTLTWDAVEGATNYAVFLRKGSTWLKIGASGANTTFTSRGLANGGKYFYMVKSYVNGAWSGESATVFAIPVCITPQNVKASAGDSKVTLTWDAVPGASNYAVFLRKGTAWLKIGASGANTTFTSRGLANGGKYFYMVKAYVNGSWSDESAIVSAIPVCITPQNVQAVGGTGEATITWDAVSGATNYAVMMKNGTSWTTLGATGTKTTYKATGLTGGETYYFVVKAFVNGAWSDMSETVSASIS